MFASGYFAPGYFPPTYFPSGTGGAPAPVVLPPIVLRTLAADKAAAIVSQHTCPIFLVEIDFDSGTQYLSESFEVSFDDDVTTYIEGGVRLNNFVWGPDGNQRGTLDLLNENNSASAIVLNNQVQDTEVRIYITYKTGPSTFTTPVLLIRGVLSGAEIKPSHSTVGVHTYGTETEFTPDEYYGVSAGFNWLPAAGTVVTWNGEKYVLAGAN